MQYAGALKSKKELQRIGLLVVKHRPDVVQELADIYPATEPHETNLTRIPTFFQHFCLIRNITPEQITTINHAGRFEKERYTRRLFVSSMLHLFMPQVLRQPGGSTAIIGGFSSMLLSVLKYSNRSVIFKLINEAVYHEKTYQDYREEVAFIVEQLKGG